MEFKLSVAPKRITYDNLSLLSMKIEQPNARRTSQSRNDRCSTVAQGECSLATHRAQVSQLSFSEWVSVKLITVKSRLRYVTVKLLKKHQKQKIIIWRRCGHRLKVYQLFMKAAEPKSYTYSCIPHLSSEKNSVSAVKRDHTFDSSSISGNHP